MADPERGYYHHLDCTCEVEPQVEDTDTLAIADVVNATISFNMPRLSICTRQVYVALATVAVNSMMSQEWTEDEIRTCLEGAIEVALEARRNALLDVAVDEADTKH